MFCHTAFPAILYCISCDDDRPPSTLKFEKSVNCIIPFTVGRVLFINIKLTLFFSRVNYEETFH